MTGLRSAVTLYKLCSPCAGIVFGPQAVSGVPVNPDLVLLQSLNSLSVGQLVNANHNHFFSISWHAATDVILHAYFVPHMNLKCGSKNHSLHC